MPDMLVKLYDLPDERPLIARLQEQEITIRPARAYEKAQVLEWVRSRFGDGWVSECDVAFGRQPVSCLIAVQNRTLLGFGCYEATCRDYFGPLGVDEAARGNGIGTALLMACLRAMARIGYAYAVIGGAGPTEFYSRAVGAIPIPGSSPGIYDGSLE